MPNILLRTLTIDGVPNDTLGAGNYLNLDADNNVEWGVERISSDELAGNVPNNSAQLIDMKTINGIGWFIGRLRGNFASNSNGIRSLMAYKNSTSLSGINIPAANGGQTIITIPVIIYCGDATTTFKARLWQNSGSALNYTNLYFEGAFIPKVGGG